MGKVEGEEFSGRQGRDQVKEPGLAGGESRAALSVFSETDSGCSMSWVLPWILSPCRACLEGGGCSRHLRAPVDGRTLKTGDPRPMLPPRGTLGHSRVHVKDPYLTCGTWRVSAPSGPQFPHRCRAALKAFAALTKECAQRLPPDGGSSRGELRVGAQAATSSGNTFPTGERLCPRDHIFLENAHSSVLSPSAPEGSHPLAPISLGLFLALAGLMWWSVRCPL